MIRVLAIGDIVGKPGRDLVKKNLHDLKKKYQADIVVANAENAAGGYGITTKIYNQLIKEGHVDGITMGDHWADNPDIYSILKTQKNICIPENMWNNDSPLSGLRIIRTPSCPNGFALINVVGKVFMNGDNRCPFKSMDQLISQIPDSVSLRIVDIHTEATSEKQALAHYCDGRVSLIFGTHTHVPTADEQILSNGSGYITDLGMTGGYDSVIGVKKGAAIHRFLTGERKKWVQAKEKPWIPFLIADLDPSSGMCLSVERSIYKSDQ